jgi:type I restriction enzyme, S subunit
MKSEQIENLPIEWKRGNGLRKSDLDETGKNKCILYGELYTKHKNVLIDSQSLSKTNQQGKVFSKKGDVLIPGTSTAAKKDMLLAREVNEDGVLLGGDINIIRPNQGLFAQKYLPYYFMTPMAYQQLDRYITGATGIIHLSNKGLKKLKVPLPSLDEQQNIIIILDKAFAAIDKAKANAKQNLQNTKELFDSYLQNVFSTKGDDWEEGEFGNIITTLTDYHANGSYKILKKNVELKDKDDYAWMIRSTDFEKSFKNQFKYIDEHAYNFMSKSKVFGNEIIMSKIGNAGKTYLMPKIDRPVSLAMNLFLIRLDESRALPQFVFQFLKSKKGESQIKKRVKGATTKTITKDNVRNIIISYPSLETQKDIVQKLEILSLETKKLEAIYIQKIADLEEMKKSVLQKAFSGQLNIIN